MNLQEEELFPAAEAMVGKLFQSRDRYGKMIRTVRGGGMTGSAYKSEVFAEKHELLLCIKADHTGATFIRESGGLVRLTFDFLHPRVSTWEEIKVEICELDEPPHPHYSGIRAYWGERALMHILAELAFPVENTSI